MLHDTLCTCHGKLRPIGGCAHAIAVLRLLGQLTHRIAPDEPSRSEKTLKRGLWYFQNSDSEEDTDTESSGASDSTDNSLSLEDYSSEEYYTYYDYMWVIRSCTRALRE